MCGIVGLFLKNSKLQEKLGEYLSSMLVKMSDRGPDSAGLALYSSQKNFDTKLTMSIRNFIFVKEMELSLDRELKGKFCINKRGSHIILQFFEIDRGIILKVLSKLEEPPRILSEGNAIEIFKDVGSPILSLIHI